MSERDQDVAIIGMACIFPKAPNMQTFWANILGKVAAITDPPDEWGADLVYDPASNENDRLYTKRGGYLGDLACFDPLAYGVMPRAVDGGEPEHLLALRVAHEALADAGYLHRTEHRQRTSVILGRGTYVNRGYITVLQHTIAVDQTLRVLSVLHPEYTPAELQAIKAALKEGLPPFNAETATSLVPSVMCGRIANRLDLMGPAYSVDAACASSLIAIEMGRADLLSGKSDLVLAGGIQVSSTFPITLIFGQLGGLARSGQLRPFHPEADGTLLGEGAGMVVLKRRADAERDGDRIYAVIKGIGTASDGRALGVLAPRVEGEELAMRRAYEQAGVSPQSVGLLEAHGTGTPVGDATEIEAIRRVYGERVGELPSCALGSVKAMIGHTIPASGVASIIKTALALHHKILPPTLHAEEGSARFDQMNVYLNGETRPWIHGGPLPRRAAVSAFGFGGINAHAVLEEHGGATEAASNLHREFDSELFILAADSRRELIASAERLQRYLDANPQAPLVDLAYTLNCTARSETGTCLSIVASTQAELTQKLQHALKKLSDPAVGRIKERSGIYFFEEPLSKTGTLVLLFPGEGSQYINMLADLCLHFPEVRAWFDLIDRALVGHHRGFLPSQVIFPPPTLEAAGDGNEKLWQMDCGTEAIFAANQALFTLLSLLEIKPRSILGHSTGEYSALYASGALRFDDEEHLVESVLKLNGIYERVQASGQIPEATLLAVGAQDRASVLKLVQESEGRLSVAMDNCQHQIVLCASAGEAEKALAMLTEEGAVCTRLPFNRAYHTPLFSGFSTELEDFYRQLKFVQPAVKMYSCATATEYPSEPDEIRRLALEQWANTVRFRETIEAMYSDGVRLFVEVGARGNLTAFVDDILRGKQYLAMPSNVPHRSGLTQLNNLLGMLAAHGVQMKLDYLYARRSPRRLSLNEEAGKEASGAKTGRMKVATNLPILSLEREKLPESVKRMMVARQSRAAASSAEARTNGDGEHGVESAQNLAPPTLAHAPARTLEITPAPVAAPPSTPAFTPVPAPSTFVSAMPAQPTARPQQGTRAGVMREYLQTMEQFLEVQQQVTRAFINRQDAPTRTGSQINTTANVSAPLIETAPARMLPLNEPARGNGHASSIENATFIENAPPAKANGHAKASGNGDGDMTAMAKPQPASRETLARTLLQLVSEKTGYPVEMLDLELNLEADLGIDSIKRIEILGALQRRTGLLEGESMERASALKTFRELIEFLTLEDGAKETPALHVAASHENGNASRKERATLSETQRALPFIGQIIRLTPGEEVLAVRRLDLDEDIFLRDHTLGGKVSGSDDNLTALPVVPLTFTMEMMAEVAALLFPGKRVIALKKIRAQRWIALEEHQLTLQLVARRETSAGGLQAEVRIYEVSEPSEVTPAPGALRAECIVLFGENYPEPPRAGEFSLCAERPSKWLPEQLYTDYMFHGPSLRGVVSIERFGEDGTEATLATLPFGRLFKSPAAQGFLTDPALLDAAGQLVGYWITEHQERGFHVFPFSVEALYLYGENRPAGELLRCRAHIALKGDWQTISDLELMGGDGRLLAKLEGWEDRRFDVPKPFYRFRSSPRDRFLSTPLSIDIEGWPQSETFSCCLLNTLSTEFLEGFGKIWQQVLAQLVLSRRERESWRELKGPETRRSQWLLGRVVAKDAARRLLKNLRGADLYPADIEIMRDEHGRPLIGGAWPDKPLDVPLISLAHTEDAAVALACDARVCEGVGIDLERLRPLNEDFKSAAFTDAERSLAHAREESFDEDECFLRLWCAKEAVAKAFGRGLLGGGRGVVALGLDARAGVVEVALASEMALRFPQARDASLHVRTAREGDLIIASAFIKRTVDEGAEDERA